MGMRSTIVAMVLIGLGNFGPAAAETITMTDPFPAAIVQGGNASVELQCNKMRFVPAGYEDAEDIVRKQALSLRFLKDGRTEISAFQIGDDNASIEIVEGYPVEVVFDDSADYDFVLDQAAKQNVLNVSMADQDVTYGIFDLKGSGKAIRFLRSSCGKLGASDTAPASSAPEAPEGIVYCGGGGIKRMIEYRFVNSGQWDVEVVINGETSRAMSSYSFFGAQPSPAGFVVALLLENGGEMLVFQQSGQNWLEYGDYRYDQCN